MRALIPLSFCQGPVLSPWSQAFSLHHPKDRVLDGVFSLPIRFLNILKIPITTTEPIYISYNRIRLYDQYGLIPTCA